MKPLVFTEDLTFFYFEDFLKHYNSLIAKELHEMTFREKARVLATFKNSAMRAAMLAAADKKNPGGKG